MKDLYGIDVNDTKPRGVLDIYKIKQIGKKFIHNAREAIADRSLNKSESGAVSVKSSVRSKKPHVSPKNEILLAQMRINLNKSVS